MSYPATWAKDAVPAAWKTHVGRRPGFPDAPIGEGPYKARQCSWCGALEFPDGAIDERGRSTKSCPRCPILTEVGRTARPPKFDVRDELDDHQGDEDEEPPRRARRRSGTMAPVTEKKKPKAPEQEPWSRWSGVFNFRPGPDLHERLAKEAERESEARREKTSLNEITKILIEEALAARAKKR